MKAYTVRKPVAIAIALALFAGAPLTDQLLADRDIDLGGTVLAAGQGQGQQMQGGGHGGAGGQGNGPQYQGGGAGGTTGGAGGVTVLSEEGDDSDGRGPKYMGGEGANKPTPGEQGGKPAWAQEGIPEVELGRLNVARAPEHVLERQYYEALDTWDAAMETFYEMTAEEAANVLASDYDNVLRFDSPLVNLALYKDLLVDGVTGLPDVTPATLNDLAAILLGSASDKTVTITTETVEAMNTILDVTMSEADVAIVAEKAEAVREAIYEGHES